MTDYNSVNTRLKLEKQRCQKQNLVRYLRKRYDQRMTDIIVMMFHFPNQFILDEYVEIVQNWVFQEDKDKARLGFLLHDVDGDGKVSPADISEL